MFLAGSPIRFLVNCKGFLPLSIMETDKNFKEILHKAQEGGYWAEVPALPGCFSQGEEIEETKENIKEAIEGYLEIDNSLLSK